MRVASAALGVNILLAHVPASASIGDSNFEDKAPDKMTLNSYILQLAWAGFVPG